MNSLHSLGLSHPVEQKLVKAGFQRIEDFNAISAVQLAKEISVSNEEALKILKIILKEEISNPSLKPVDAKTLLDEWSKRVPILTFSQELDEMLGGGVMSGEITEFCGMPGIGKTQLGMQLAVSCTMPEFFDGLGGESIYLDTEGSFVLERMIEIAESTVAHIRAIASENEGKLEESKKVADEYTLESILSKIHIYRVHDIIEQSAILHVLFDIIQANPKIKLVVLDSIAFHMRHDLDNQARGRIISAMSENICQLAQTFSIAVVVMNQMTTKVSSVGGIETSHLVPALGDRWTPSNRILLSWKSGGRLAEMKHSSSRPQSTVAYSVSTEGIR